MSYSSTVDDSNLSLVWVLRFAVIPLYVLSVLVMIWTNSPILETKTLLVVTLIIMQIINIVAMIADFFSVFKALSSVSKGFPTVKMVTMIATCCITSATMFTVNTLLGF